jgi:hypothetical protein
MGWLKRKPKALTLRCIDISSGDFGQAVAGEGSYQEALRKASNAAERDEQERPVFQVILLPEPDNKFDENAVQVFHPQWGVLGYLPRDDAEEISPRLRELYQSGDGEAAACLAVAYGGDNARPSIGIWLDADFDELE